MGLVSSIVVQKVADEKMERNIPPIPKTYEKAIHGSFDEIEPSAPSEATTVALIIGNLSSYIPTVDTHVMEEFASSLRLHAPMKNFVQSRTRIDRRRPQQQTSTRATHSSRSSNPALGDATKSGRMDTAMYIAAPPHQQLSWMIWPRRYPSAESFFCSGKDIDLCIL